MGGCKFPVLDSLGVVELGGQKFFVPVEDVLWGLSIAREVEIFSVGDLGESLNFLVPDQREGGDAESIRDDVRVEPVCDDAAEL